MKTLIIAFYVVLFLVGCGGVTKGTHTYTVKAISVGDLVLLNKALRDNKLTAIFYANSIAN